MNFAELWTNLDPEIKARINQNAIAQEFKRGDFIYNSGDKPQGIYIVEEGLVGLSLIGKDSGKEHFMRFFSNGQFFGHRALFSDEVYHASTVVLEKTKVKLIPKNVFLSILDDHPHLYKDFLKCVSRELGQCENLHVMILENQILPRTAQALIYLKRLHPEHNWTRQEIANFTASTTSTIIKAMAELENMGLIRQIGRNIEILNPEGLLNLQNF